MSENSKRVRASIIVINESGEAMQYSPLDGTNAGLAFALEEAGCLTDELAKHLGQPVSSE